MTKRGDWINFIVGGRGDDILQGTAGRDVLLGDGVHWGWSRCWWQPGRGGNDTLDGGAGSDVVLAGRGNDVANYTLAENRGASDYYDGGKGVDTLRLTLTHAELQLASVQQDIAAFEAFLDRRANPHGEHGKVFHFRSFELDVRNFEALEIRLLNAPPVAQDDSYAVDEDTVLLVPGPGVSGNDADAEGAALAVALVAGPAHGTLALNPDGSFSYTPDADFNGSDSFTYRANDGGLDSNLATVALAVNPVNDAPTAADGGASTDEDTAVAGSVSAGDVDGDSLAAALVQGPAHGEVALNADGTYVYTPAADYFGADSFTFQVNDGQAVSGIASVSLEIAPVNDAPVAHDDVLTEPANDPGPIRVAVVGGSTSSYVAAAAQLEDSTAFDIDADAIAVTAFATAAQWTELLQAYEVVVLGDSGFGLDYGSTQLFPALRGFVDAGGGVVTTGWFAYAMPGISAALRGDADYITPLSVQPYQFTSTGATITVLDSAHPITEGLASYQVVARNHELAGGVDAGATILATGQGNGGTRAAIAYDEVGQGLTVYFGSPQMANQANYQPDRTPDGAADRIFERAVAWAAGERGGDAVTDEDTPFVIDDAFLLANDTDVENDLLALASVSATSVLGGAVSIDENGDIVYDPRAALQHLDAGQIVTDSFDYVVSDGNGGTDTASLSFTVAGRADSDTLL
jgi:VCBS repeat-containing protein